MAEGGSGAKEERRGGGREEVGHRRLLKSVGEQKCYKYISPAIQVYYGVRDVRRYLMGRD